MKIKKKVLIIIISSLILGFSLWGSFYINRNKCKDPYEPWFAGYWLEFKEATIYENGTAFFSLYCNYEYNCENQSIPDDDLIRIQKIFLSNEDVFLLVNISEYLHEGSGVIYNISYVTVLTGDFNLGAFDEISFTFQTTFPLQTGMELYIGVLEDQDIPWQTKLTVV